MSTDETPENFTRVRTSDAEREQVAEVLRNAVTEGRLNLEEGDERLAALYQTKFRDELPALVADLPQGQSWKSAPTSGAASGPENGRRGGGRAGTPAGGPGQWGGPMPGPWGGPFPGGGPFGGGPFGGSGPDPAMWRRRRLFRGVPIAVIVAGLITFTILTGHFFWPIIPLLFLFHVMRIGAWRRRMGGYGWGCGQQQYGRDADYDDGQGYGQGYYGPGYRPGNGQYRGPGSGGAA